MKNALLIAAVVVTSVSIDVGAQDAAAVIEAAARAMGTTSLKSIQYSGTGTNNSLGQAYTPGGPWPRFKVTKYLALLNLDAPALRQEIIRIDAEAPPRGGGAGPFTASTGQGGIRPIPGDIVQNQNADGRTELGALNIWLTPHGFVKGAMTNAGSAKVTTARGKKVVSFRAFDKYTVAGTLDDHDLVERVETRIDNGFAGDMLVEAIYSSYSDFGGVKFPTHIVQQQGGHPVLDIAVADVQPNSAAALDVRGTPQRGGGPPAGPAPGAAGVKIEPEKIADGIWFLNFGAPQSILVEFSDHVVIVEAPGNDERSVATIAEAKRLLPNKPIKYLISTHHHFDHSGGLRAYVAEGIPIIAHEAQKRYYEQEVFRNPHTINPDRLARSPRAAKVEAMKDKRVLTDGKMTLEIHLIRGNLHSEGLLMVYVPGEKLLMQSDAFHPRPGAKPLAAPSPYTTNLLENIRRLKLDVARLVQVHGGVEPFSALLKAAGE